MKSFKYDDILNVPYPQPTGRPRMSLEERAAHFSPFAALTGYEDAVEETARYTETAVELDEDEKTRLDALLRWIQEHLPQQPRAELVYFCPDSRKSGGEYVTVTGVVQKLDLYRRTLTLEGDRVIPIEAIRSIGIL